MDEPAVDIGKRITFLREQKGLTVEVLSYLCEALDTTLQDFFTSPSDTMSEKEELILTISRLSKTQRQHLLAFIQSMM